MLMEIQLILIGGIYGVQAFEPVALTDLPATVRAFATELAAGGGSTAEPDTSALTPRTERETFEIEISRNDGTKATYSWPMDARADDPRLDQLYEALWSTAKPVPQP